MSWSAAGNAQPRNDREDTFLGQDFQDPKDSGYPQEFGGSGMALTDVARE